MIERFVAWMHSWQDLFGALVGGLLGVIGALIVATNIVRRERRSSARLVLIDLWRVASVYERAAKMHQAEAPKTPFEEWLPKYLGQHKHRLSRLFEAATVSLLDRGVHAAATLRAFAASYDEMKSYLRPFTKVAEHPNSSVPDKSARELLLTAFQVSYRNARIADYLVTPMANAFFDRQWILMRRAWQPSPRDAETQRMFDQLKKERYV